MAIEAVSKVIPFRETQRPEIKVVDVPQVSEQKPIKTNAANAENGQEGSEQENNQAGSQANQKHIQNVINDANFKMKNMKTKCEFSYHEPTKRVSIKIIDKETNEVVREVPPEETLRMIEKIWELAGIMVDEKR